MDPEDCGLTKGLRAIEGTCVCVCVCVFGVDLCAFLHVCMCTCACECVICLSKGGMHLQTCIHTRSDTHTLGGAV